MDEPEWLACGDPYMMLWCLKGKDNDRKMRLFVAACCRRVWHRLTDPRSRVAIEVAEQYADGQAGNPAREAARLGAKAAMLESKRGTDGDSAWALRGELVALAVASNVTASLLTWLFNETAQNKNPTGEPAEKEAQVDLLRDLHGPSPFRPASLDPVWRTSAVLALAQAAYDHRTLPVGTLEPDRLAVLADALEEAGCDNADILGHLRDIGPHVRGCWAVDLILGAK